MKVQKAQPVFASRHTQPEIQFKQIKLGTGEKPAWQILAEQNKTPLGFDQKSQLGASRYTQQTSTSQVLHSYSDTAGSVLNTDSIYADIYPEQPPMQLIQPQAAQDEVHRQKNEQTKSRLPPIELEEQHEFRPFYERKRLQQQTQQEQKVEDKSFLKLNQQKREPMATKMQSQSSQGYEQLKERNQQLKQLIGQQITQQKQKEQYYYQNESDDDQDENDDQYRVIRPSNFSRQRVKTEDNSINHENIDMVDPNTQLSKIDVLLQKIDALDRRFNLNLDEPQNQQMEFKNVKNENQPTQINQQVTMQQDIQRQQYFQQRGNQVDNRPIQISMADAYNSYQDAEEVRPIVEFKQDQDEKIRQLQENQVQMQQENKLLQETIKILQQQLQNQELMEQNRMNNQLLMRQIELQEQMLGKNNQQQYLIQQQQMQHLREKYQREWREQQQAPPSRTANYLDQYNAEYNRKLLNQNTTRENVQQFAYKTTKIVDPYAEEPKQYKVATVKTKAKGKQMVQKDTEINENYASNPSKVDKNKSSLQYENFRIQPFYDTEIEELDDVSHRLQLQIDGLFD